MWTRLPQGYTEFPTLFSQILWADLSSISLPGGLTLIQYVDDLLLASDTEQTCKADTYHLLLSLAQRGHKASPSKLQYLQQKVTYLGYVIAPRIRKLVPGRIETILGMKPPHKKRQVHALLGILGFCRPWIPSFGALAKPLIQLTTKDMPGFINWTRPLTNFGENKANTSFSASPWSA